MPCSNKYICVDESADYRVVIAALEVVQFVFYIIDIAAVAEGVVLTQCRCEGAGAVIAGGVVAPYIVGVGNNCCACVVQNGGNVTLEIGGVVIGSTVVGDGLGCSAGIVGEIQGVAVYIGDGGLIMVILESQLAAKNGNAAVRLHLIRQLR